MPSHQKLLPKIASHSNIGPWPTFCNKMLLNQSLIVWKNKKYLVGRFPTDGGVRSESFTFLPKPFMTCPHVHLCPSPVDHTLQALYQTLCSSFLWNFLPLIFACQILFQITLQRHCSCGPHSHMKPPLAVLLVCAYRAACAQPWEPPSFCWVWWIFMSA